MTIYMPEDNQQAEHENILRAVASGVARMPAFVACLAGSPSAMPGGAPCRSIDVQSGVARGHPPCIVS